MTDLGWSDDFLQGAPAALAADPIPARVTEVTRDRLIALGPDGPLTLLPLLPSGDHAVGDFVLTDGARALWLCPRRTVIARRAAGIESARQLVAANLDRLAIVTSCNADFNLARLERYLAMAYQGNVTPLIVLTKPDLAENPGAYAARAATILPAEQVLLLNARDPSSTEALAPHCGPGLTLALVGSSGVGKTTLQNHLTGVTAATQGIREDDAKGRHTTTARQMRPTRAGGWLIDTPGIRELQLSEAGDGIAAVFADLEALAATCRFRDCRHETEPGCAIRAAIADGTVEAARLDRWRKLDREDRFNTETMAQRRDRIRTFAKATKAGRERSRSKRQIDDED